MNGITYKELGHEMDGRVCTRCGMRIIEDRFGHLVRTSGGVYPVNWVDEKVFGFGLTIDGEGFIEIRVDKDIEWVWGTFNCGKLIVRDILE
jgi:hypothetical protein